MIRFFNFSTGVAIVSLLIAVAYAAATFRLVEPAMFQQISAKLWPGVLAAALAICALLLMFDRGSQEESAPNADERSPGGIRVWLSVGGIFLSAPLLNYLGFWATGTLLMLFMAWLHEGWAHAARNVTVAIVVPGAVYLLFTKVFSQFLPAGILVEGIAF